MWHTGPLNCIDMHQNITAIFQPHELSMNLSLVCVLQPRPACSCAADIVGTPDQQDVDKM